MNVTKTALDGVIIVEPRVFSDARGFFMETFNANSYEKAGLPTRFVQDNHSLSTEPGTLRGLHYQVAPHAQGKLVRCIKGSIDDIVVDLRRESATFKKWIKIQLSSENKLQLFIPEGFAHGFVTLEPNTEVVYKVTEFYSPTHERSIAWNDPDLKIEWNIDDPVLSDKDRMAPPLREAQLF